MKHKSLISLVFLVIFMFSMTALASAPSKTASDMAKTTSTKTSTSTSTSTSTTPSTIPEVVPVIITVVQPTAEVTAEVEKIQEFIANNDKPVIDFFDFESGATGESSVKEQIIKLLPTGFDVETLVMNELVPAKAPAYNSTMGDVEAMFEFATGYEVDQVIVAVVGVFDASGNVEWIPLEASVVKDTDGVNRVKIVFTQEALVKVGNTTFALAILSEDK